MQRINLTSLFTLVFFVFTNQAYASESPWFTGPLLAPAGHTIPRGHTNVEVYGFYNGVTGSYDNRGNLIKSPGNKTRTITPLFSHGLTDRLDVQFSLPFVQSHRGQIKSHHIGDAGATIGFQALEQKDSRWRPDLRVTIQEVFPTGRFEQLNPVYKGTDSTGVGGYQTGFSFDFQNLQQVTEVHYLRSRLSLSYVATSKVLTHGESGIGTGLLADGVASPGDVWSIDLAGEYTLTQNWVVVMEGFASRQTKSTFKGFPGFIAPGVLATPGNGISKLITLAPALEFNFNANVGIIGGVWFSIAGQNNADFIASVLALNAYW